MTDSAAGLFLSKLLPVFVMPLGLALGLAAVGSVFALRARPGSATVCFGVAMAWLWIAATPAFAEWLLGTLEWQHPPRALSDTPPAEVAIVLGGAVGQLVPPRAALDLSASSDRILHATRLYRAGKVGRVLVAGGNLPWLVTAVPEADLIRELLVEWGVPADRIEIGGQSRNTYENAREVAHMRTRRPFASALLVTSAAHMPRALAVFRRAGLPVVPSTTDVDIVDGGPSTILRWLPDAGALEMSTRAIKEWIGYWVYRARGYA
jgi:uncharacterized SAM-binding protein YcdF (DUF218 family)